MKTVVAHGAEVVDPSVLETGEKTKFIDDLYSLHQKIFAGVSRETFQSRIVDPPAQWTRIRIYRNEQGKAVGYCAFHRFHLCQDHQELVVFRASAGILRAYVGRSITLWFGLSEVIKYHLRYPFKNCWYLGSFVHPAVFYMFSRYIQIFYPQVGKKTPTHVKQLMMSLAEEFHLQPVSGQNELVRNVGSITRQSDQDRDFWQYHRNPTVRYYIETNPGYVNGSGLLVLMPLTFLNVFLSLFRFVGIKLYKKLRKLLPNTVK